MPYICMKRTDIPDGVLQVLDLKPNTSLRNSILEGAGQTKYISHPAQSTVTVSAGVVSSSSGALVEGLAAYLADRVEPGGTQAATGTVTMSGPLVGDTLTFTGPGGVLTRVYTAVENTATGTVTAATPVAGVAALTLGGVACSCVENAATGTITANAVVNGNTVSIAGVTFTAAAAADHANRIFLNSAAAGSDILCAADLATCINTAGPQALITAALGAEAGVTITGANGGTAVVTLTCSVPGAYGDASLVGTAIRLVVSGATMTHTDANPAANPPQFNSFAHFTGQGTAAAKNALVATSIAAMVNNAATQAKLDVANPGPAPGSKNGHMTAAAAATVVTLTASQAGWSGQLTLASVGATLAVSGATLTRTAADPSLFQFDSLLNASTNILAATSFVSALNNAASDTALGTTIGGSAVTATNVGGTSAIVTITADTTGSLGAMPITPSAAGRTAVSANALGKTMVTWTAAQLNAAATAIQNLVVAGSAVTTTAINVVINAVAGVSGVSILIGGSLQDILEILSGRSYQVSIPVTKDPTGKNWSSTATGSFPAPYVHNYTTDSMLLSAGIGALSTYMSSAFTYGGTTGSALVVYNDDGTVFTP